MKTILIPGAGFEVSRFCLGCAYYGSRESEELSFQLLDYYYDHGGRFINTAHEYGYGKSETTIGKWVKERGVRHEVIVTSKGGEDHTKPHSVAMHREELLEDIDESLSRTGFDYLDFYNLHLDDETVPVAEIIGTMADIQKSGKIRHYGCSNWSVERQREATAYAKAHGIEDFVMDEIEMNLAFKNRPNATSHIKWLDSDYVAEHEHDGKAVGGYTAVLHGLLTKFIRDGDTRSWAEWQIIPYDNPHNREIARRLGKLSAETGFSPSALQIAWIMNQPHKFPSFAIVGTSKLYQLEDCMAAADIELTQEQMDWLHGDDLDY